MQLSASMLTSWMPKVNREKVNSMRGRLHDLLAARSRKSIFGPAGISEATLSRILGSGAHPIDNPRVFTLQAIAEAAGATVGELLGERGHELTASDREELSRFAAWIAMKLGSEGGISWRPSTPSVGRQAPHVDEADTFDPADQRFRAEGKQSK